MNTLQVDLTNCDREPIQHPGAIQPHGLLFACRADDLLISHVSQNVPTRICAPLEQLIGQPLVSIFSPAEATEFELLLRNDVTEGRPVYLFSVRLQGCDENFDAIAHRNGPQLFLELEPRTDGLQISATELYRLLQNSIRQLQIAPSVDVLCELCARHVRRIAGFDRVMVYRFDPEWNGQVVAEERREDLEPFLGLHYPASDIPQQARELYTKNWLRFIADRDYVASPLVPASGPDTNHPLDLSYSVLRSVSPIHLEYLRNMGVSASMSVSLIKDGRLWGLIACHHYSARFVPYDVRTACELLGQLMSLSIAAAEDRELQEYRNAMEQQMSQLFACLASADSVTTALVNGQPNLLSIMQADGAAVIVGDQVLRIGQTPREKEIRDLGRWLKDEHPSGFLATDQLQQGYGSGLLGSVASGLLAVSFATASHHHVLWFRTEQERTVDWAGDPRKTLAKGDGEARLSPRGSFALWRETVRGRSAPWTAEEQNAARKFRELLIAELVDRAEKLAAEHSDLQQVSREREEILESERAARTESERLHEMKDTFVATLSHELRTPLNAILGWTQLLQYQKDSAEHVTEGLTVIERNARVQAQMIEDLLDMSRIIAGKLRLDLQDTDLPTIIESAISTVALAAEAKGVRIEKLIDPMSGVRTTGDPQRLQQVVWNLLSNAVKFTPRGGKVQVVLERVKSHVELTISDTGAGIAAEFLPYVFERFRQSDATAAREHGGLGLGLSIVRNLVELHGGTVRAASRGSGFGATFVVSLPVRVVADQDASEPGRPAASDSRSPHRGIDLRGIRILSVDDQVDARSLMLRVLDDAGCKVLSAENALAALELLRQHEVDVILSDIGMPGMDGYAFIRQLRHDELTGGRQKTPAIALTAYARGEDRRRAILAGFQAHVTKPVDVEELLALIGSLTNRI